jgi:hypothetical protein
MSWESRLAIAKRVDLPTETILQAQHLRCITGSISPAFPLNVSTIRVVGWRAFEPLESLFWSFKGLDIHPSIHSDGFSILCGSRRGSFITYANCGAWRMCFMPIRLIVSVAAKYP